MTADTLVQQWQREFAQEKEAILKNDNLLQHEKDTQIALRQQDLYNSVLKLRTKRETNLNDVNKKLSLIKQSNTTSVNKNYAVTSEEQLRRIGDLLERFLLTQQIMTINEKEFIRAYEHYWNCGNRLALELFNHSAQKLSVQGRMKFSELKNRLEAEGFTSEEKIAIQNAHHFERELSAIDEFLKQVRR